MENLQPGIKIKGRYTLKKYIDRGSFGEVWLAYDEYLTMDVAIKLYISLDNKGIDEFKNEYKTAYGMNHPNLLNTTYFDVWENRPFLVMKYCPNGSAENMAGNCPESRIWQFIYDVSAGLAYLHGQEPEPIIHQDIKPNNVLIDEHDRFLITDFGISRKMRSTMRKQSKRKDEKEGSIGYMAPERFSQNPILVKASDIWSLGASIYELANGDLPLCGQGGGMLLHGAELPILGSNWSRELNTVMQACLAKNAWERPTATELVGYISARKRGETLPMPWKERGRVDFPPLPEHRERHGFVSFWLKFGLTINVLSALLFIAVGFSERLQEAAFVAVCSMVSAWGLYMLLKWKKWGYWILWIPSICSSYMFSYETYGTSNGLFVAITSSSVGMLILYGILHIKKNGRSTWEQLEEDFSLALTTKTQYALAGVAALLLVLLLIYTGNKPDPLTIEAQEHLSAYHQTAERCQRLTEEGNNGNVELLLEAKNAMNSLLEMETRYASVCSEYNKSQTLENKLNNKLNDAHEAWIKAAESQYTKAKDINKSISYYQTALSLKEDATARNRFVSLAKEAGYVYIKNVSFANSDKNGNVEGNYGDTLYASQIRYLLSTMTYDGLSDESQTINLHIKIIDPYGNIVSGASSPSGYSYDTQVTIEPGTSKSIQLSGWGNSNGGTYVAGKYQFEIWYKEKKLFGCDINIKK